MTPDAAAIAALHEARIAEKKQARFYRALAAAAEAALDPATAERLNGLHADEQHHFSRITARLLELGETLPDAESARPHVASLASWEPHALEAERAEVERYRALLRQRLDARTERMIREFLEVERAHLAQLGGKWMRA